MHFYRGASAFSKRISPAHRKEKQVKEVGTTERIREKMCAYKLLLLVGDTGVAPDQWQPTNY